MKRKALYLSVVLCTFIISNVFSVTVSVKNPTKSPWVDVPVVIPIQDSIKDADSGKLVLTGDEIIPVQSVDLDNDKKADELVAVVSIAPGETKKWTLSQNTFNFTPASRAHTGMYIKGFEGPGWESEKIAYRLYWDERNAMDIFAKKTPCLGLDIYATPGTNYHKETPGGMDILQVGPSLGSGSYGIWLNGKIEGVAKAEREYEILADGPVKSVIELKYKNWTAGERKLNLISRISMTAGQKWFAVELWLTPLDENPAPEIVAGIVKHEETTLIQNKEEGIIGRWGLQALGPDNKPKESNLGMGIVVADPKSIVEFGEDANNTFVRMKGSDSNQRIVGPIKGVGKINHDTRYVKYYVHASWVQEQGGAASAKEYEDMLHDLAVMKPEVTVSEK